MVRGMWALGLGRACRLDSAAPQSPGAQRGFWQGKLRVGCLGDVGGEGSTKAGELKAEAVRCIYNN